jgi:hypothetical protein
MAEVALNSLTRDIKCDSRKQQLVISNLPHYAIPPSRVSSVAFQLPVHLL